MSGLAQWLAQRGDSVTGSARAPGPIVERLRRSGVRVLIGPTARAGSLCAQQLVYAPGIERHHPERLVAARRGIRQLSCSERLAQVAAEHASLVVLGGREASVAAAMIGWTLTRAGCDPTVILGRAVPQLGGWARQGSGRHVVLEAIDAAGEFGPVGPELAVLLDIESGPHGEDRSRIEALQRFTASIPSDGHVLALTPQRLVAAALRGFGGRVEGLSLEPGQSWWGGDLREQRGRYRFRAYHHGRFVVEIGLNVPGRGHVISALAAVAACVRLDVPPLEIKEGLEEFTGIAGAFDSRGSYRGVTLVDDSGRDSAAVAATLALGRAVYGRRRLWAVYHCETAAEGPWAEGPERFAAAFTQADRVLILESSPHDVAPPARRSAAAALAQALSQAGVAARWMPRLDDAISDLDQHLEPGDVLVTLGAGDVGTIADALVRRLPRDRQGE
jgi:UDP-N-acetylmuramate--alanine ligase